MKTLSTLLLFILLGCNSQYASLKRISDPLSFVVQLGTTTTYLPKNGVNPNHGFRDDCAGFVVDQYKNSYCAGLTNGSVGEQNPAPGTADIIVVKFDPNGKILWATQIGNTTKDTQGTANLADDTINNNEDSCVTIAVDKDGNVYCGGRTSSPLDGPGSNLGNDDAVVLKLNNNGEVQWITQFGSTLSEVCLDVDVSTDGTVYCSGSTIGEMVADERNTARTDRDGFVTAISSSGVVTGTIQFGEKTLADKNSLNLSNLISIDANETFQNVSIDSSGSLIISGITLGSLAAPTTDMASPFDDRDIIVLKLSSTLAPQWIKQYPSVGNDFVLDTILSSSGNIIGAGFTEGSFADTNGGLADVLIFEINSTGDIVKQSQLGSSVQVPGGDVSYPESCRTLAEDRQGNIYCGGATLGAIGEENADNTHLTGDVFIAKFDKDLKFIDAIQLGKYTHVNGRDNNNDEGVNGLHIDYFGNIYGGGETLSSLAEQNAGLRDIFIFKFDNTYLNLKDVQL